MRRKSVNYFILIRSSNSGFFTHAYIIRIYYTHYKMFLNSRDYADRVYRNEIEISFLGVAIDMHPLLEINLDIQGPDAHQICKHLGGRVLGCPMEINCSPKGDYYYQWCSE